MFDAVRKKVLLYLMALVYVAAGVNHFVSTASYIAIIPAWLSYPKLLVFVSGFCEMLLGILLLFYKTRRYAAIGIILLLIAVFPANIQMAINYYYNGNKFFWLAIVRLPLQFVLIWWAYTYTKPIAST